MPISPYDAQARRGFTLTEIAVVLVIISLLVGSVVVGTSLIRSSRVRSITADKEMYQNAILAFKDRYAALPGDMATATDIWGYATGAVAPITVAKDNACKILTTQSTDKTTCNGNGDEHIAEPTSGGTGHGHEMYRMWQHLANAGFIEGTFGGATNCAPASGMCVKPGLNAPFSKIDKATFWVNDVGILTAPNAWYDMVWTTQVDTHLMFFGAVNNVTTGTNPYYPIITSNEAISIDQKLDDGFPGRGKIRVISPTATNPYTSAQACADATGTPPAAATATYNRDEPRNECTLYFYMPF